MTDYYVCLHVSPKIGPADDFSSRVREAGLDHILTSWMMSFKYVVKLLTEASGLMPFIGDMPCPTSWANLLC